MLLSRLKTGEPEIFATLQGEGVSVGTPAVFVRLAECNLRCSWCDTKYTWDWASHDRTKETIELPAGDVLARVTAEAGAETRTVVFTGGEPLLQQDELGPLGQQLHGLGFRLEVETNGTITPTATMASIIDQWNVSPKLRSSGNGERARHRPATLEWFASRPNAYLKLVITEGCQEEDLREVDALATAMGSFPKERIILMPEGTEASAITNRAQALAPRAVAGGYRLGARLHVLLWGSERGR